VTEANQEIAKRSRRLLWVTLLVIIVILGLAIAVRQRISQTSGFLGQFNKTTVSQAVVVEKVEAVAKLVSSESTMRDVVIYENSWYGSTKRSLVVVTGKILAGINLEGGADVNIDDKSRRITITLPQATILAIEITELKTYDEQRGLWNSFEPGDRDKIFQLAREQLENSSKELKMTEHANQSAKRFLETMFDTDGYTAEVVFRPSP
jgi:predicted RNA-binding protein Jag